MDWFLYDNGLRHERVNKKYLLKKKSIQYALQYTIHYTIEVQYYCKIVFESHILYSVIDTHRIFYFTNETMSAN